MAGVKKFSDGPIKTAHTGSETRKWVAGEFRGILLEFRGLFCYNAFVGFWLMRVLI